MFHIGANIEKLRFLFNINVACKIDVIAASQTTFVCVLKVQGIVTSDILRSQTDHALPCTV